MNIKNMGLSIPLATEKLSRHMPKKPSRRKDNFVEQAKKDRAYYRKMGYEI